jgi:hypothetical protein
MAGQKRLNKCRAKAQREDVNFYPSAKADGNSEVDKKTLKK